MSTPTKRVKVGDWVRFRSWIDGHKRWARVTNKSSGMLGVEYSDVGDGQGPWKQAVDALNGELLEIDNEPVRVDAGPRTMG